MNRKVNLLMIGLIIIAVSKSEALDYWNIFFGLYMCSLMNFISFLSCYIAWKMAWWVLASADQLNSQACQHSHKVLCDIFRAQFFFSFPFFFFFFFYCIGSSLLWGLSLVAVIRSYSFYAVQGLLTEVAGFSYCGAWDVGYVDFSSWGMWAQ